MTKIPQAAIDLAQRFEGLRLKPYRCPAGIPTIGYGSTCYPSGLAVKLSDAPITETLAEIYLQHDLSQAMNATLRCCPLLAAEPPARLAAIVDFTFNLGAGRLQASTLRRRINQQDWPGAAAELRRWVYAGAKVLPGLVARREAECALLIAG
jgi:lysozyme